MQILEMDKIIDELFEENKDITEEFKRKLAKVIDKKLKDNEDKITSRTEYQHIRRNIMDFVLNNAIYDIVWSYDSFIDEENVISFNKE